MYFKYTYLYFITCKTVYSLNCWFVFFRANNFFFYFILDSPSFPTPQIFVLIISVSSAFNPSSVLNYEDSVLWVLCLSVASLNIINTSLI